MLFFFFSFFFFPTRCLPPSLKVGQRSVRVMRSEAQSCCSSSVSRWNQSKWRLVRMSAWNLSITCAHKPACAHTNMRRHTFTHAWDAKLRVKALERRCWISLFNLNIVPGFLCSFFTALPPWRSLATRCTAVQSCQWLFLAFAWLFFFFFTANSHPLSLC